MHTVSPRFFSTPAHLPLTLPDPSKPPLWDQLAEQSCDKILHILSTIAPVKKFYSDDVLAHTQKVIDNANKYRKFLEPEISKVCLWSEFLLFLALHDIGKGIVSKEEVAASIWIENPLLEEELETTRPLLSSIMRQLEIPESKIRLFYALLKYDCQGLYLTGDISLEEAFDNILEMANYAGIDPIFFHRILRAYHIMDAITYRNLTDLFVRSNDGITYCEMYTELDNSLAKALEDSVKGEEYFFDLLQRLSAEENPLTIHDDFVKYLPQLLRFLERTHKEMISYPKDQEIYRSVKKGFRNLLLYFASGSRDLGTLKTAYLNFLENPDHHEPNLFIDPSANVPPKDLLDLEKRLVRFRRDYLCRYAMTKVFAHMPQASEETQLLLRITHLYPSSSAVLPDLQKTKGRLMTRERLVQTKIHSTENSPQQQQYRLLGRDLNTQASDQDVLPPIVPKEAKIIADILDKGSITSDEGIRLAKAVLRLRMLSKQLYQPYRIRLLSLIDYVKKESKDSLLLIEWLQMAVDKDLDTTRALEQVLEGRMAPIEGVEDIIKTTLGKSPITPDEGFRLARAVIRLRILDEQKYATYQDRLLSLTEHVTKESKNSLLLLEWLQMAIDEQFNVPQILQGILDDRYRIVFASTTAHTFHSNENPSYDRHAPKSLHLGKDIQIIFTESPEKLAPFLIENHLQENVRIFPLTALEAATRANRLAHRYFADIASYSKMEKLERAKNRFRLLVISSTQIATGLYLLATRQGKSGGLLFSAGASGFKYASEEYPGTKEYLLETVKGAATSAISLGVGHIVKIPANVSQWTRTAYAVGISGLSAGMGRLSRRVFGERGDTPLPEETAVAAVGAGLGAVVGEMVPGNLGPVLTGGVKAFSDAFVSGLAVGAWNNSRTKDPSKKKSLSDLPKEAFRYALIPAGVGLVTGYAEKCENDEKRAQLDQVEAELSSKEQQIKTAENNRREELQKAEQEKVALDQSIAQDQQSLASIEQELHQAQVLADRARQDRDAFRERIRRGVNSHLSKDHKAKIDGRYNTDPNAITDALMAGKEINWRKGGIPGYTNEKIKIKSSHQKALEQAEQKVLSLQKSKQQLETSRIQKQETSKVIRGKIESINMQSNPLPAQDQQSSQQQAARLREEVSNPSTRLPNRSENLSLGSNQPTMAGRPPTVPNNVENLKKLIQSPPIGFSEEDCSIKTLTPHVVLVHALNHAPPPANLAISRLKMDPEDKMDPQEKFDFYINNVISSDGTIGRHLDLENIKPTHFEDRPHMHWSWNQLVQPCGKKKTDGTRVNNWEEAKVAFLEPLSKFEETYSDKPFSVSPYDTYTISPHRFSKGSTLVVERSVADRVVAHLQDFQGRIFIYENEPLRVAIIKALNTHYKETWHICDAEGNPIGGTCRPSADGYDPETYLKTSSGRIIQLIKKSGKDPSERSAEAMKAWREEGRYIGLHVGSITFWIEDEKHEYFQTLKACKQEPSNIQSSTYFAGNIERVENLGILEVVKFYEEANRHDRATGIMKVANYLFNEAVYVDLMSLLLKQKNQYTLSSLDAKMIVESIRILLLNILDNIQRDIDNNRIDGAWKLFSEDEFSYCSLLGASARDLKQSEEEVREMLRQPQEDISQKPQCLSVGQAEWDAIPTPENIEFELDQHWLNQSGLMNYVNKVISTLPDSPVHLAQLHQYLLQLQTRELKEQYKIKIICNVIYWALKEQFYNSKQGEWAESSILRHRLLKEYGWLSSKYGLEIELLSGHEGSGLFESLIYQISDSKTNLSELRSEIDTYVDEDEEKACDTPIPRTELTLHALASRFNSPIVVLQKEVPPKVYNIEGEATPLFLHRSDEGIFQPCFPIKWLAPAKIYEKIRERFFYGWLSSKYDLEIELFSDYEGSGLFESLIHQISNPKPDLSQLRSEIDTHVDKDEEKACDTPIPRTELALHELASHFNSPIVVLQKGVPPKIYNIAGEAAPFFLHRSDRDIFQPCFPIEGLAPAKIYEKIRERFYREWRLRV